MIGKPDLKYSLLTISLSLNLLKKCFRKMNSRKKVVSKLEKCSVFPFIWLLPMSILISGSLKQILSTFLNANNRVTSSWGRKFEGIFPKRTRPFSITSDLFLYMRKRHFWAIFLFQKFLFKEISEIAIESTSNFRFRT